MITVARSQVVIDWIISLGWNASQEVGYPLFAGPEIISSPDKAVFVTASGGPGWVTEEGALDAWSFQVLVRGPDDDPLAPELAAQQLDALIFNGAGVHVDNVWIAAATRAGSPPSVLPLDPQDRRFLFSCSYILTTGGG